MDWSREFLGNTLTQWATAFAVALLITAALRLTFRVVVARLEALSRRTQNDLDDLAVELLGKTRTLFIALVALWVGARPLQLPEVVHTWLEVVLHAGIILQIGFWGMGIVNYAVSHYKTRELEDDPGFATAVGAMGFVVRLGLWAVLLLTFLKSALDVDITAFVASLGIGGIAVALALQNVLGDLFASMSIVLDKPFVIGDFIVVGDFSGTVEHVGLKTTRIRSISGEQLVFSNSDLLGSRIRNYKRMQERRVVFQIGVVYGTSPEKLRAIPELVREAVETQDNTRFDRSHMKAFGGSSLDFESVYFMTVPDYAAYMDTQQAINLALYEAFAERGIEFAFPTQTLFVQRVGEDVGSGNGAREAVEAGS
ncbi:MAG TPA: mechanosensitive ion channel family protein [Longimicrobiales bacterium]|nr:mechanosensitive ion channel family protein [Longimicrobiales bacterium]